MLVRLRAASSGLFTPLVLQMFAVGEETGSLDTLMQTVAEFYERDVDYELVVEHAQLVVDTRGVYRAPRQNVVKA